MAILSHSGEAALPLVNLSKSDSQPKMHIFVILAFSAFPRLSIALHPPTLLSPNASSPSPLTLSATTPLGEPWPRVPWTYVMNELATIAIEHYGRHVCAGDLRCEKRVMESIAQILWDIDQEYIEEHQRISSFTSDAVVFWIQQETTLPKFLVEELVAHLYRFTSNYGTTEITHAGVVSFGGLAATFELTFPGIPS